MPGPRRGWAGRGAGGLRPAFPPFYRPGISDGGASAAIVGPGRRRRRVAARGGGVLQNGPVACNGIACSVKRPLAGGRESAGTVRGILAIARTARAALGGCPAGAPGLPFGASRRSGPTGGAARRRFSQAVCRATECRPREPERVQLDVTFVRQHFKNLRAGDAGGSWPFLADGGRSSRAGRGDLL